jgi:hypothetical protein
MSTIYSLFNEIKQGNNDKVKTIIKQDSKLLNKYLYGANAFIYSIECGREEIAIELASQMKGSSEFNSKDNLNRSCLEIAIHNKLDKTVEYICSNLKPDQLNRIQEDNGETYLTQSLKENDQISLALINGNKNKY